MNEETFLTGLRNLAELPVPGPLPEQQVIARGRVARRRRAAFRTATAAAGTALAVAAAVGIPSGYFTALDPARPPAPLTNGDTLVSQWTTTVGTLADDPDVGTGLRDRARALLRGRPVDVRLLVATDLEHERIALLAAPQAGGAHAMIWLVGPPGTPPDQLRPWSCTSQVLCVVPVRVDGWPGDAPAGTGPEGLNRPPADELIRELVAATLDGATVTAWANDVDDTGRPVTRDVPVSGAGTAGLFRVADVPAGPLQVLAARGSGTAKAPVGFAAPIQAGVFEDLRIRLRNPSVRGSGAYEQRPTADDLAALRLLLAEVLAATGFPQDGWVYEPLYAARQGSRRVVVLAVQSPSKGWVVIPADIDQRPGRQPAVVLEALVPMPPGGPSVRGFAWHTRYTDGALRGDGAAQDRVAVLGPRGAEVAEVTGASGVVRLPLVDGYAEGVVPGAGRVRFLGDRGVVVAETEVAPLLPRNGTLLPR